MPYYMDIHCIMYFQAHALYNSVNVRQPDDEEWHKKVFSTQMDYWKEHSQMTYEQHRSLKFQLQSELRSIREVNNREVAGSEYLVNNLEQTIRQACETDHAFYDFMKTLSIRCSEDMLKFTRRIIQSSIDILNDKPSCEFTVVAIGSIARGEATPYSDLEYLFLVEDNNQEAASYFEQLAITTYFLIGNLGETKLTNFDIEELNGWFDDRAKSGFKIDGLAKGAGNIPTGRGTEDRNHFITTPRQLSERYKRFLDNPCPQQGLHGDITQLLKYRKKIYQYGSSDLYDDVENTLEKIPISLSRQAANVRMLTYDLMKYDFVPSTAGLERRGFSINVKKDLYRFPSILLLDLSVLFNDHSETSWHALESLRNSSHLSPDLYSTMQFLLASATYIRLQTYLHHDSQDDRISVTKVNKMVHEPKTLPDDGSISTRRWFLPSKLFQKLSALSVPLKHALCVHVSIDSTASDIASLLQSYNVFNDGYYARADIYSISRGGKMCL